MFVITYFMLTVIATLQCRRVEDLKVYYRSLPPVDFSLSDAQKTDIIYKYFKDAKQETPKLLTEDTVAQENFNKSIPLILIIHGWTTDDTSPWYKPLKDELFKLGPHNIVYINWSKAGNKTYDVSSANCKPVGEFMAQFLVKSGVHPENIHLIGHSLGSQLTAFIGKSMVKFSGKKIGRITALDPAGPKFENPSMGPETRLCDTDADFVEVIHTDIQLSGYAAPIGHVDVYPNGGTDQPGCPSRELDDNCWHARATLFFIESVSRKSKAKEARYEEDNYVVNISVIQNGTEIIFGHHVNGSSRGVYVIETRSEKPYLN